MIMTPPDPINVFASPDFRLCLLIYRLLGAVYQPLITHFLLGLSLIDCFPDNSVASD